MTETIVGIILAFGAVIGLFILMRQMVNWYFRINERYDLMVKTYRKLDEISRKLGEDPAAKPSPGLEPEGEQKGTVYYKNKS